MPKELKYIYYIKERVIGISSLSSIEVILSVSLSPSKYIEYIVMFSFLLVIVPIYFSIYKILLLLIGKVYTIIKLIKVINLIRVT